MTAGRDCGRLALLGVAAVCIGSVGFALLSQYQFGMQPCPWCTFQRLLYLVIAALALLAAAGGGLLRRALAALAALVAAGGVVAAYWQHFHAAQDDACNLTLADRILQSLGLFDLAPSVFAPMASCAEAEVSLLGVPYAFWSLALFLALCAALALLAAGRMACPRRL